MKSKKAISLFSGAGIGDLGFQIAGLNFIAMCELEDERAILAKLNFPDTQMFLGDIYNLIEDIVSTIKLTKDTEDLFLISCTAPCQGMSKSGRGKLLREIREGRRPKMDSRNRLILPALEIIKKLRPIFVVFENVIEMRDTIIETEPNIFLPILDVIKLKLQPEYIGEAYDVEFADYGVPQRRRRLITIYTRDNKIKDFLKKGVPLIPPITHTKNGNGHLKKWISVTEALESFPPLDAKTSETSSCPNILFHRVPVLDPKKYVWVSNTKYGCSAFDNQCINQNCLYKGNRTHGASRNEEGINIANKDTPLYCERCGSLLPRPYTETASGKIRIMRGYTSAYKRMEADLPAPAITRNMSFACSDNKVHPFENRVLSLAEAMVIHTLNEFPFKWGPIINKKGKYLKLAPDSLIRLVIGESIPPRFTYLVGKYLIKLSESEDYEKIYLETISSKMPLFASVNHRQMRSEGYK